MKLQIDTKDKIFHLEEEVNALELMKIIKKLFPNGQWKEFTISIKPIYQWVNPIYVPYVQEKPIYPWYITTSETTTNAYSTELNPGIFNVQTTELATD